MRILKLRKKNLRHFVEALASAGELFVPKKVSRLSYRLELYERFEEIAWNYLRTVVPPKKFFFPQRETLLTSENGVGYRVPEIEDKQIILFGLHPCDINALMIDDVFFGKYTPDFYYQRRRRQGIIVGLGCIPDKHCFCKSMKADTVESGYDLFLTDLGSYFLVHISTLAGDRLIEPIVDKLEAPPAGALRDYETYLRRRTNAFALELDIKNLPDKLELQKTHAVWKDIGERCLACGNCSLGCPTCTCFNVIDTNALTPGADERCRIWDSCLYRDYARVAGGHNFRIDRSERIKNRYFHKQYGFVEQFGMPSCVGCGRCTVTCPTRIDFVEVFQRLGA